MNLVRAIVIILTQVPLLYFELGRRDLLGGFNQTDQGFGLLIGLVVIVPLLNLFWLMFETTRTLKQVREQGFNRGIVLPFVALLFLFEAVIIDLYLLSHVRM